ncbi:helix-turn-helix transcriptional regulator [Kribbella sandramycini]|nr:helix-turn-helix domain-containing protein [Kribbella sandramycini]NOL41126.1 helix-turn-helix transcriptional regulator [Kribbella sandramycini]
MLRAWRDRADPAEVGLPANGHRRAPGLRREELALLAGISIEYVVRLEQGRTRTPSASVCSALARALRLTDAEQAHLFRLAGHADDPERVSRQIPAGVRWMLERLEDRPIVVLDAMFTMIAWNDLYAALYGDPSALDERERNTLWRHFVRGSGRQRHTAEAREAFERSIVADLRGSTSRYPRDPELRRLVDELLVASPRFAQLWRERQVAAVQPSRKMVDHPEVGTVNVDCDALATQIGDLRLLIMTPADDESRGRLELLATLGTQAWSIS